LTTHRAQSLATAASPPAPFLVDPCELARVAALTALGMEGIARLPAVGTLDWCQQAASGLALIHPGGIVATMLVRAAEPLTNPTLQSAFTLPTHVQSHASSTPPSSAPAHPFPQATGAYHHPARAVPLRPAAQQPVHPNQPANSTPANSTLANSTPTNSTSPSQPAPQHAPITHVHPIPTNFGRLRIAGIIAGGVALGGELAAIRQLLPAHATRLAQEIRARVEDLVDRLLPTDTDLTLDFARHAAAAFIPVEPRTEALAAALPLDVGARDRWIVTILAHPAGALADHDSRTLAAALSGITQVLARKTAIALSNDTDSWLSAREQAVLERLVLGRNVKEIAAEFGRSPHTIHDHVKSLHRKLHATSRGELIATALGLIDRRGRAPSRSPSRSLGQRTA
jgi:DNA-binding NarL/FixJ family response regulator